MNRCRKLVAGAGLTLALLGSGAVAHAAPPRPAQVPSTASLVWNGDWETNDFSQWETVQNQGYNGVASGFPGSYSTSINSDRFDSGLRSGMFEVRDGDVPSFGGGERAEVSAPDIANAREGETRYYSFSMRFAPDFVCEDLSYNIVTQWHAGSGSPPMALMVDKSCNLLLTNNVTNSGNKVIGNIAKGQWVDYVMQVKHSKSSSIGWAKVWRDGVLTVPQHARASLSDEASYLKQGIYRSSAATSRAVVYIDGTAVWKP